MADSRSYTKPQFLPKEDLKGGGAALAPPYSVVAPATPGPGLPQPITHRKPRVREVSSRFMSPSSSFSNCTPLRSSSVHKQRQTEEPLSCADENRLVRITPQRKHQQRSAIKLFKENGGIRHEQVRFQRADHESSLLPSPNQIRSSMPEVSVFPIVPGRLLLDKSVNMPNRANTDSFKSFLASPCSRSLDFPQSEHSVIHPLRIPEKTKQCATSSIKTGGLPYARKGKKVHSHQEDVHCLRLLHNHYLQWRYVNAKAEASTKAQRRETERILFSLSIRISELYDFLKCRRVLLSILRRRKALSTVVEAQMPYLEEWSSLEGDYSASLLEALQALSNVSLRLPISGNIRADVKEVGEAFNSAMKLMELIALHVQKFIPKAEEMENLVSELARVAGGERALVEECGNLLSKIKLTDHRQRSAAYVLSLFN